jgi:hypothetical protein
MPHLGEGTFPKKTNDTPKIFGKDYQKPTCSPYYYVPKIKLGIEMPVTSKKPLLTGSTSVHQIKNKNIAETIPIPTSYCRNTVRIGLGGNRCFSTLLFPNKTSTSQKYLGN